eukprot:jgi/Bigna1/38027/e_gw1.23.137.1
MTEALYNRGIAYQHLGQMGKAIADFSRVLDLDSQHAHAAFARAACQNIIGKFSQAIEDYELALKNDGLASSSHSHQYSNRNSLGLARFTTLNSPRADPAWNSVAESPNSKPLLASSNNSRTADELCKSGGKRSKKGKLAEALKLYEEAIRLEPKHFKAHFNRGYALYKLGRFQEATEAYTVAVRINPSSCLTFYNRGISRNKAGDIVGAIADFTLAIQIIVSFHHNRGILYTKLKEFAHATDDYSMVLELNPKHVRAMINRAKCMFELRRFQDALVDYNAALKVAVDPSYLHILLARAAALQRRGDLDNALSDLSLILRQAPSHLEALNARAFVLVSQGLYRLAIQDYKTLYRLNPKDTDALFNTAVCLENLSETSLAVEIYTKAINQSPSYAAAHLNRGLLLEKLGKIARSRKDLRRAEELGALMTRTKRI